MPSSRLGWASEEAAQADDGARPGAELGGPRMQAAGDDAGSWSGRRRRCTGSGRSGTGRPHPGEVEEAAGLFLQIPSIGGATSRLGELLVVLLVRRRRGRDEGRVTGRAANQNIIMYPHQRCGRATGTIVILDITFLSLPSVLHVSFNPRPVYSLIDQRARSLFDRSKKQTSGK